MPIANQTDDENDQDAGPPPEAPPEEPPPEEEQQQVGSATGAPKQAPQQHAQQQEYVPWSSFEAANRDVSQRESKKLQGKVQGDVDHARTELGDAQEAFDAGLDSNYVRGGKQKLAAAQGGFGQLEASMFDEPQAAAGAGNVAQQQQQSLVTPTTSNPWESFLSGRPDAFQSQVTAPAPEISATAAPSTGIGDLFGGPGARMHAGEPEAAPLGSRLAQFDNDPLHLTSDAIGGKAAGSKDLETSMGKDAWQSLLGDTLGAQQEANALGSEEGVQALLQRAGTTPGPYGYSGLDAKSGPAAFDAALINGAGQRDFGQLAQQFGGDQLTKGVVDAQKGSQDRWKQLQGDIAAHQPRVDDAGAPPGALDADSAAPQTSQDKSLHELLYGEDGQDFFSLMHQAGLSFSPADWAAIGIGESGEDVGMPTEEFSKNFDYSKGEIQKSWPPGKFQMAWGMVDKQYAPEAMKAALSYLSNNPAALKQYLAMHNPGFMARNLRALIESLGFKKSDVTGSGTNHWSQTGGAQGVEAAGRTTGEADQGTTDEQETARLNAYRDGWGTEWDEQFKQGNQKPSQPGA